jgi:hypothetical protein
MKKLLLHFFLFFTSITIFSLLYYREMKDRNEAIYNSVMIQTLIGVVPDENITPKIKTLHTIQALISYALITGILIFFVSKVAHHKKH